MLINLSNHPVAKWSPEQAAAGRANYGEILDFSFPNVDPAATGQELEALAEQLAAECRERIAEAAEQTNAVHVMGEFTLTYRIVRRLEPSGIDCVASTTERVVKENPDGTKTTTFRFVGFRSYF